MKAVNRALPLLASEQVGPKGWINTIYVFQLDADYDATRIASILLSAWKNFKRQTPMVGVEVVPEDLQQQPAGMFKLQAYEDGEIEDFVLRDHRDDADMLTFAQLKEQGFPNGAMDDEKLCLRKLGGPWPNFGVDRLATTMMQVNMIKGGLLLNHLCLHMTGDGAGMWKLTELFADEVRRAQGMSIECPAKVTVRDREKLLHSTGKYDLAAFAAAHPEWVHLPFVPPGFPDALVNASHHAHVFRFSPEAITALKDECAPSNVHLLKNQASVTPLPGFISTNDALTALLWRSIQRAQHTNPSKIAADKVSLCQVALDTRRRAYEEIHAHTLGNVIGYTATSLPLSEVVSAQKASLADLAVMVRMAVNKCGKQYHDQLAYYIENMDNVNSLAGTCFLDMPGANVLQSNWSKFDYYGIEWGPEFGHRMKALRFPASGICAGFQVIMPTPADAPKGTVDVLVDVTEDAWQHLLADETWKRFAANPTTTVYR
ncbi:unnamed protein product [Aureobasidium uvarum]|uniref:Trichothecene 3-O-acetyltransferase-like N-terminal domain-containing protein n=1 Tax=Aureobasidium uvarum TaxID=2773716 RepID=A0A9N8KLZ4_9PEZI|nr:unnamed protein product [Aureobasidium uvarum]